MSVGKDTQNQRVVPAEILACAPDFNWGGRLYMYHWGIESFWLSTIKMGSYTQITGQNLQSRRGRHRDSKHKEDLMCLCWLWSKSGSYTKECGWSLGDKTRPQLTASKEMRACKELKSAHHLKELESRFFLRALHEQAWLTSWFCLCETLRRPE